MSRVSNTEPEDPLLQRDAAELWRQRAAFMTTATVCGAALEAAMTDPVTAEQLHARLARDGGPLVEPDDDDDHVLVTFVYRAEGEPTGVEVVGMLRHHGGRTSTEPVLVHPMDAIPGTDLWADGSSASRPANHLPHPPIHRAACAVRRVP